MKATVSRDGKKRFDLRITHRVGADDIAVILCYRHREDGEDGVDRLPEYSRAAILELVRDQLQLDADAPKWWQDGVEEEWIGEVWEWADALVRRRFPELY